MKSNIFRRGLPLATVIILALALGLVGCKKKMPKEAPPPPPKVEEVKPAPAPAPDTTGQADRDMKAAMDADKGRIQIIYFDYDKSEIRSDQRTNLTGNADIFRKWATWKISIEGNCDERGTPEYNLALGQRRADAAKQALIAGGIDATRITTVSYGKERPADPGHNEAAYTKNRRDEFKVQ